MKIPDPTILKQATQLFDVNINTVRYLGGEDADVYEIYQGNQPFIVKLTPVDEKGIITLNEKIDFARYLRINGVRVARWLPSIHDRWVEIIRQDGMIVAVTKLEKINGNHPNMRNEKEWNTALFNEWGRVLGRMHWLAQQYEGGIHIGHWQDEVAFFINWCSDPEVKEHWYAMENYLKTLPASPNVYGLIHNDLHQWNFMLEQGKIIIFDFDVCGHHWFLTDIGIALFHGLWVDSWKKTPATQERLQRFFDRFMAGYTTEMELDAHWRERLPFFLKYRQLLSYTVFSDPESYTHATGWQRRWVTEMRKGIIENIPVLELKF